MRREGETPGAQNMRRSLRILRVLAAHQADGVSATEVMRLAELERSTAHRLLQCLVEEGFAERDPRSRRYRLGVEAMQIGIASLRRAPLVATYGPVMQRLARISEDTVYLMMRQGDYSVCLHREDGSFPVRLFSTRVGDSRPLGIGVAAMSILASCSDEEIAGIRTRHAGAFNAAGLTPTLVARAVARTRRLGYAELLDTITQGTGGVGMVLPQASGTPFAAISIASISSRMGAVRRGELGALLKRELQGGLQRESKTGIRRS